MTTPGRRTGSGGEHDPAVGPIDRRRDHRPSRSSRPGVAYAVEHRTPRAFVWLVTPALLVATTVIVAPAVADGKMLAPTGRSAPELPWQRAVVAHGNGQQVLVVQSAAARTWAEPADGERVGWLLPVSATPTTVASMEDWAVEDLWQQIAVEARPEVVWARDVWGPTLLVAASVFFIGLGVWKTRRSDESRGTWRVVAIRVGVVVVVLGMWAVLLPALSRPRGSTVGDVTVERHEQVGMHDVRVVSGVSAEAMIAFTRDAGFEVDASSARSIADHVARGWRFVLSDIDIDVGAAPGAPDPLVLVFPTEQAIYPLALTGSAGTPTEVQLAVIRRARLDGEIEAADARGMMPELQYRGPGGGRIYWFDIWGTFEEGTLPTMDELFGPDDARAGDVILEYRRGVLAPEDMQSDLVFDDETVAAFRPRVVRW